ncbi:PaaX family transcriptional regulator [Prescottella agglutinans]|uniref:Phenylacetic acid degradation operon negative regulatory protein n=1 Tax=Prescottella agglutinans TaxID=1644129 RepID=A0ABT6ML30_9NOCA|nr:PaaX family transcriptional regulator C-terminal domain-containing protein [Prescottella agglutinans]MDH6285015.1 phenylacetic acid degradation operon negative regulatory protein [Prescottella agglutinans]
MTTTPDRSDGKAPTRQLSPGTARATVLDILGDLVFPSTEPAPTTAFIELMGQLDFTEHAVRQALSRCAGDGWIAGTRVGRTTSWSLTEDGRRLVTDGIAGVERLSYEHADWDGRWLVLVVTIPRENRASRDRVYRSLRWDGFGNPAPAVWLSPYSDRRRRTTHTLDRLGIADTLAFFGESDPLGLPDEELVARGWDMDGVAELYRQCHAEFAAAQPRSRADKSATLLRLDAQLQQLLVTDPQLPGALLPEWTGRADAAALLDLRQRWRPAARAYWQALVESSA